MLDRTPEPLPIYRRVCNGHNVFICMKEAVQKIVSFAGARPNPKEEPARLTHFSEQSRMK